MRLVAIPNVAIALIFVIVQVYKSMESLQVLFSRYFVVVALVAL